jgi:hypothetical protein
MTSVVKSCFLKSLEGDRLVMRKKVGGGVSVKAKHVEDVWELVRSINGGVNVPRVLRGRWLFSRKLGKREIG